MKKRLLNILIKLKSNGLPIVFTFLIFSSLIIGCEEDITVDLPTPEDKIVVDGFIQTDSFPIVYLSKNAAYFDSVNVSALEKLIIHDAIVTVSNGTKTEKLTEFITPTGQKTGYYFTLAMRGENGKSYTLDVQSEGKHVWSTIKIPIPIPLDSAVFYPETEGDSIGRIRAKLTDPDTLGNYYRVMNRRVNKKYYVKNLLGMMQPPEYAPPGNSLQEDRLFNGKSFDIRFGRGIPANSPELEDESRERGRFKVGDSISIKWMSIAKEVFDFYRTLGASNNTNGNPFASPVTIKTNIKGPGLGVWAGYGVTYKFVIAK